MRYIQTFYKQLSPYFMDLTCFQVETEKEVKILDKIFKVHNINSILDVACGVGRVSIPLVKLGYNVTGIDYSKYQLKEAKKYAKTEDVQLKFILKDANKLHFNNKFDAAICMWTTLSEEPMVYKEVISRVYKALKPKGIFVIENNDWSEIEKSKEKKSVNTYKVDSRNITVYIHDRFTKHFRIRDVITKFNNDKEFNDMCITYIKTPSEWINEFKKAGFRNCSVIKNYKKKKNKYLIVAEK